MTELDRLLARLGEAGVPLDSAVHAAMRSVDIADFSDYDPLPFWHDRPLVFLETTRGGVKTISAPHMVATMLHHLELDRGQQVLVLGAKGGYIAALIAHIVGPEGGVVVVDPSREVIEHVRERLEPLSGTHEVRVRKMVRLDRAPPHLPEPLQRVLVTGSVPALPPWLERRVDEAGFVVAPIGGRIAQRLVKRERQGEFWIDTDLGGVLFGPVDIAETEIEPLGAAAIAELLEEGAALGEEIELFDDETLARLSTLALALRDLPEDLPSPLLMEAVEAMGQMDLDEEPPMIDLEDIFDADHPLVDLLHAEMEWLGPVWPTLVALVDVRMIHPGDPGGSEFDGAEDDEDDAGGGGFGRHEDLVP